MPARIHIFGAPVDNLTIPEAAAAAVELACGSEPSLMTTLNTDILRHYYEDPVFAGIFDDAALITLDGAPLYKLARRMGSPVCEKVSGPDLMPEVCRLAAECGLSCFILGGAEGVPEAAARTLSRRFPGLKFVGALSPVYGFASDKEVSRFVARQVRDASPNILFVCLGTPRSEMWWDRWGDEMGVPLSMSLGAAVDFMAGNVRRAPKWMSDAGLEWLWRASREPSRLVGRYARDAVFLAKMLRREDLCSQMRGEGVDL